MGNHGSLDSDAMVDYLIREKYITQRNVERAFRLVDRFNFLPVEHRRFSHLAMEVNNEQFQPGTLRVSAIDVYAQVVEYLKLSRGETFLNVGTGSGYFSTLVGTLLGDTGHNHGIELYPNLVEYSTKMIEEWMTTPGASSVGWARPDIRLGDIYNTNFTNAHKDKYDKIYVGFVVRTEEQLSRIIRMLKIGGILLAPNEERMCRYVRLTDSQTNVEVLDRVTFRFGEEVPKDLQPATPIFESFHPLTYHARQVLRTKCRKESYNRDVLKIINRSMRVPRGGYRIPPGIRGRDRNIEVRRQYHERMEEEERAADERRRRHPLRPRARDRETLRLWRMAEPHLATTMDPEQFRFFEESIENRFPVTRENPPGVQAQAPRVHVPDAAEGVLDIELMVRHTEDQAQAPSAHVPDAAEGVLDMELITRHTEDNLRATSPAPSHESNHPINGSVEDLTEEPMTEPDVPHYVYTDAEIQRMRQEYEARPSTSNAPRLPDSLIAANHWMAEQAARHDGRELDDVLMSLMDCKKKMKRVRMMVEVEKKEEEDKDQPSTSEEPSSSNGASTSKDKPSGSSRPSTDEPSTSGPSTSAARPSGSNKPKPKSSTSDKKGSKGSKGGLSSSDEPSSSTKPSTLAKKNSKTSAKSSSSEPSSSDQPSSSDAKPSTSDKKPKDSEDSGPSTSSGKPKSKPSTSTKSSSRVGGPSTSDQSSSSAEPSTSIKKPKSSTEGPPTSSTKKSSKKPSTSTKEKPSSSAPSTSSGPSSSSSDQPSSSTKKPKKSKKPDEAAKQKREYLKMVRRMMLEPMIQMPYRSPLDELCIVIDGPEPRRRSISEGGASTSEDQEERRRQNLIRSGFLVQWDTWQETIQETQHRLEQLDPRADEMRQELWTDTLLLQSQRQPSFGIMQVRRVDVPQPPVPEEIRIDFVFNSNIAIADPYPDLSGDEDEEEEEEPGERAPAHYGFYFHLGPPLSHNEMRRRARATEDPFLLNEYYQRAVNEASLPEPESEIDMEAQEELARLRHDRDDAIATADSDYQERIQNLELPPHLKNYVKSAEIVLDENIPF